MLRADFIIVNEDESQEMGGGVILFKGKLHHTEGNRDMTGAALDDPKAAMFATPQEFLEAFAGLYAGSAVYATEMYDDLDSRYDEFGMYVGDETAGFSIVGDHVT